MSSKNSKKKLDTGRFVNSGLLVCLLIYATIATLLLFRNFFENLNHDCGTQEGGTTARIGVTSGSGRYSSSRDGKGMSSRSSAGLYLPYLPANELDFLTLLQPSQDVRCAHLKLLQSKHISEQPVPTEDGMEGTHLCMDTLPQHPTNPNCRIYSLDPSPENVYFELKMGRNGCRVHLITNNTDLNYGRISNNSYMYPLHISSLPGPSHYSLDNFINLMSHENKLIHLVKTSSNSSEWRLLNTLYTSKTEAWKFIQQIRMLVHVPLLTPKTNDEFSHKFLLLRGLHELGFHLVYSQPVLMEGEPQPDRHQLARRYETIWLKHSPLV